MKRYSVKPETRKRCKIAKIAEVNLGLYSLINMELFHFLFEVDPVPFCLYFRVEDDLIEYMRPEETSIELLKSLQLALTKEYFGLAVYILNADAPLFYQIMQEVRQQKIEKVLKEAPHLDRSTLEMFSDLSQASQMVVRGGLTQEVSGQVAHAATRLVDKLMENTTAIGTLTKMVHCDPTLYDHSAAVAMIASVIAGKLLKKPFPRNAQELVARAGLYHDVGKTCIPSHILNKPGSFTPEEFVIMKTHTNLGYDELRRAQSEGATIEDIVARVALEHHERFDGNGYPNKRKGRAEDDDQNGIHMITRIITIADVYSALLMKRVYKPAMDAGQAIKIMSDHYKTDYDPEIFLPFLKHVVESLNYHTEKKPGSKGRILIMEDGKLKLSS